jgi:hypothetical protein
MESARIHRAGETKVNDIQLFLAIGIPTVAVLASLVASLLQISGVRDTLREIREDIREIRTDIKIMTGKIAEIDNRLTVLENR